MGVSGECMHVNVMCEIYVSITACLRGRVVVLEVAVTVGEDGIRAMEWNACVCIRMCV